MCNVLYFQMAVHFLLQKSSLLFYWTVRRRTVYSPFDYLQKNQQRQYIVNDHDVSFIIFI
uniref:Uncharacterized protein n=1 Tax=Anguilla anguilla TaxID=7936 RepID=A0A0E9RE20_ANGAN